MQAGPSLRPAPRSLEAGGARSVSGSDRLLTSGRLVSVLARLTAREAKRKQREAPGAKAKRRLGRAKFATARQEEVEEY